MKRLNPFLGQTVSLFDACFSTVETASAVRQRISDLYNHGVISGLTVGESSTYSGQAYATLGTAYDPQGDRVRVDTLQDGLKYNGANLNAVVASYIVVARYVEGNDGTSGLDVDGASNFRHLMDSYTLNVLKSGTDVLGDNDTRLGGLEVTLVGSTLILDSSVRDTFSSKFDSSLNVQANNLYIPGTLLVGGTSTFVGTVTFESTFNGESNFKTDGDFICNEQGKGLICSSPDNTKTARIGIDDSGVLSFQPLNYSF